MSNARLAAFVVVFHILAADAFAQIGQGRLIGSVTDAPHLRIHSSRQQFSNGKRCGAFRE